MVNELRPPVLESSTRISKFYAPTDSEHKFNKTEMENWLPIGYNWEPTVITTTLCSSANWVSLQVLYPSIKFWNNPGNISLPETV